MKSVQASLVLETREMIRILKIVTPRGAPTSKIGYPILAGQSTKI